MGGYGSGWHRRAKVTVESCRQLDINRFAREGNLDGPAFCWQWINGRGEKTASIIVYPQADGLRLGYTATIYGKKQDMDYLVPIEYLPVGYGERPYFLCPLCGTRCLKLYLNSEYFTCRTCANVNYESTREKYADRMLNRARKIRRRLGVSEATVYSILPCDKPKRMRWYTFDRLKAEAEHFEARGWAIFAQELGLLNENGRKQKPDKT